MAGGCGGCPPTKPNKGRAAHPCQPHHEWDPRRWQTLSQQGWANGGPGGQSPHGGGLWGVSPHKTKRGNELPTLATPPRVGPKTLANPKPARVGKGGPGGRSPMAGGCGGCPPTKPKEGASSPLWKPCHEWGLKRWQTLSPRGWETGGGGGGAPSQGARGMCPQKLKIGDEQPTPAILPRVGPKTLANPKPTRVGKTHKTAISVAQNWRLW